MKIIVISRSAMVSFRSWMISACTDTSSADVGSSATMISGAASRARACRRAALTARELVRIGRAGCERAPTIHHDRCVRRFFPAANFAPKRCFRRAFGVCHAGVQGREDPGRSSAPGRGGRCGDRSGNVEFAGTDPDPARKRRIKAGD